MHYHVSHNIPGYLPEGDTFTTDDVREALGYLADELERSAGSIQEASDIADEEHAPEKDVAALRDEAERVFGMASVLAWASDNPTDRFDLQSDGTMVLVDDVATGGLSVGIDHMPDSPHSLGLNFHLTTCDEEGCEDDEA